CPELRVRIRTDRYMIPDVSVFLGCEPEERVPSKPPLIAIEILSSDDRLAEVREKLEEYHDWGVPHVWLIDPHARRFYTCDGSFIEVPTLRIPELNVELTPSQLFK